jgi:hypothetical protein
MSVAEAQRRISSAEFVEWCAYDRIDPYGPERLDYHAGLIASMIANVNAAGGKTYTAADFMPKFDRRVKRQTPAEARANFLTFASAHNGRTKRG